MGAAVAAALLALLVVVVASAAAAPVGQLSFQRCVEDNDAAPDNCSPQMDGLGGAQAIAVSPDRRSVYVLGSDDSSLVRLDRNRATGALSFGQCFDDPSGGGEAACPAVEGLTSTSDVLVSPDGRFVYVGSPNDHAISRFNRNTTTGALTYAGCVEEVASRRTVRRA